MRQRFSSFNQILYLHFYFKGFIIKIDYLCTLKIEDMRSLIIHRKYEGIIMKIAYALYRVSTKQQIDPDQKDIPMQKSACREFAEKQGWKLEKEFEEKGVSGFKVSAQDRDAIHSLKEAALNKKFQVLLVFMFDRIGRIYDETPFVVEWFVKHDIEVWSVVEGEQRFESHVDKLTNYIRFWQAFGESEKTSTRIRTRMRQLTEEGRYTGGPVPYGYSLVPAGQYNKKGVELHNLSVDAEEAEIVKTIFLKTVQEGYGSYQLASFLNHKGIRTHAGSKSQSNTINRILRNKMYCGYIVRKETTSPFIPRYKIIDEELYNRAQYILNQRGKRDIEKRQISHLIREKALLVGNVYCAHCGGKITTTRYQDRYIRKDGTEYLVDQAKYRCYNKCKKLCACEGQSTYIADKIDNAIIGIVHKIFNSIKEEPVERQIKELFRRKVSGNKLAQKRLQMEQDKNEKQLQLLQQEIAKSLLGDSMYTSSDLSQALKTLREKIAETENRLSELQLEVQKEENFISDLLPSYRRLESWTKIFDIASIEQQRMIIGQLFKKIELGYGYQIICEMNMSYQQFCSEWIQEELKAS